MAANDIKVLKENAQGTFDEVVLTGADIGLEKPASGNASSTQVVLGNDSRLSDARTPSSHAASHAAGGSDPVSPASIGAQSIFETATAATNTGTLTASRAKIWSLLDFTNSSYNLKLPRTGAQVGDIVVIRVPSNASWGANSQVTIGYDFEDTPGVPDFTSLITISQKGVQYRYQCTTSDSSGAIYSLVDVDTHTHAASAITSGTLAHERGGLEADVSAYNGLVKISGGSTSAVTVSATGESVIGAADAAAARSAISAAAATHTHPSTDISGLAASATTDTTNASNISTGTLSPARMGSGTPSASNYLRGDGSWQTVAAGGVTSGSVDNAILRADGTGGSTSQGSAFIIADNATASPNNTVNHASIQATGDTTNVSVSVVPKGTGSFSLAVPNGTSVGGNARGTNAVDLQTNRAQATQVASGTNSFACGRENSATALDSIAAGGRVNTASGETSGVFAGGNNTASQNNAVVLGGGSNTASGGSSAVIAGSSCTASASNSLAIGLSATADRSGMIAHGGAGGGLGAQRLFYVLRHRVSTAAAVELLGDGPGGSVRLTVPSGRTLACIVNLLAATSGGEFSNQYVRSVMIANRGGTTALRGAVKDIDTEEQIAGCDITITANDGSVDALRVEFSGVAPVTGCTTSGSGTAAVINKVAHGYSNNDDIIFTVLTGGAGLTANTTTYWVINATADTFQVSTIRGGGAVNITTNYTDMTANRLFRVVASVDAVEIQHGT